MTTEDIDIPDLYEFDRERHEFKIRGRRVPSVTQALRDAGLVRFFCSRGVLENARRRGSDVHMLVADIDRHPDKHYFQDTELAGYGRAWFAFKHEFGFVHDASEQPVYNNIHQYAGILDKRGRIFAGTSRERPVLLEIKSGAEVPWHAEQLAGYVLAVNDRAAASNTPERWAVYLRPDGRFRAKQFDDLRDFSYFLAALCISRLRDQRGLIHKDIAFDEIFTGEIERAAFPGIQP